MIDCEHWKQHETNSKLGVCALGKFKGQPSSLQCERHCNVYHAKRHAQPVEQLVPLRVAPRSKPHGCGCSRAQRGKK